MLAKKYKLSGYLVSQIIKKGRRWESPLFTLKYLSFGILASDLGNYPKDKLPVDCSLFAVIVPAKVEKKAVGRNRLKRQLYEIIRLNLDKFKPGTGMVFLIKKEILGKNYSDIEVEIKQLFAKA